MSSNDKLILRGVCSSLTDYNSVGTEVICRKQTIMQMIPAHGKQMTPIYNHTKEFSPVENTLT